MLLLFHYIKSVKLCISKIGGITEIVWFFTSRQLSPHKSATGIDFSFIFSSPLIVYQLIISSFALLCRTATALSLSLSLSLSSLLSRARFFPFKSQLYPCTQFVLSPSFRSHHNANVSPAWFNIIYISSSTPTQSALFHPPGSGLL